MREVEIKKISVDEDGRLLVVPSLTALGDFALIYRAAMEVTWSASGRGLLAPAPRPGGWSYSDGFQQIFRAATQEYGAKLVITPRTIWSVPLDVRSQIEGSLAAM